MTINTPPSPVDDMAELFRASLVDDPAVWRNTLLIPGDWQTPTPDETVTFLTQLSEEQRQNDRIPLPVLYRPLAAKRLRLSWLPLDLWQIALNVEFDVGILDVFAARDDNFTFGRKRKSQGKSRHHLASDIFSASFEHLNRSDKHSDDFSPAAVHAKFAPQATEIRDQTAIECATLCLGLARREKGRLRVIHPTDKRTVLTATNTQLSDGVMDHINEPRVRKADQNTWVDLTVAYGEGAYNVSVKLNDETLTLDRVKRVATLRNIRPELIVGPVRLSDCERPTPPDRKNTDDSGEADTES